LQEVETLRLKNEQSELTAKNLSRRNGEIEKLLKVKEHELEKLRTKFANASKVNKILLKEI